MSPIVTGLVVRSRFWGEDIAKPDLFE